jgi:hypothetical protein
VANRDNRNCFLPEAAGIAEGKKPFFPTVSEINECHFLTLRARVEYTKEFNTSH